MTSPRLKPKDFKGSRQRCLMLLSRPSALVTDSLSELVSPHATVETSDFWRPRGFTDPDEPQLCKTPGFLAQEICDEVLNWWLAIRRNNPTTLVLDIAATCSVPGYEQKGIVIVEAKAHWSELDESGKRFDAKTNKPNHERIGNCIQEANTGLGEGWNLARDSHYQLSNRFAWAWKLSELGIPVVLVHLGFLHATEMNDPFLTPEDWEKCLLAHADGIVPKNARGKNLNPGGAPFIPLIRSVDFKMISANPIT
jgi:hypothetical protein